MWLTSCRQSICKWELTGRLFPSSRWSLSSKKMGVQKATFRATRGYGSVWRLPVTVWVFVRITMTLQAAMFLLLIMCARTRSWLMDAQLFKQSQLYTNQYSARLGKAAHRTLCSVVNLEVSLLQTSQGQTPTKTAQMEHRLAFHTTKPTIWFATQMPITHPHAESQRSFSKRWQNHRMPDTVTTLKFSTTITWASSTRKWLQDCRWLR